MPGSSASVAKFREQVRQLLGDTSDVLLPSAGGQIPFDEWVTDPFRCKLGVQALQPNIPIGTYAIASRQSCWKQNTRDRAVVRTVRAPELTHLGWSTSSAHSARLLSRASWFVRVTGVEPYEFTPGIDIRGLTFAGGGTDSQLVLAFLDALMSRIDPPFIDAETCNGQCSTRLFDHWTCIAKLTLGAPRYQPDRREYRLYIRGDEVLRGQTSIYPHEALRTVRDHLVKQALSTSCRSESTEGGIVARATGELLDESPETRDIFANRPWSPYAARPREPQD